jgi:hypothetical protein
MKHAQEISDVYLAAVDRWRGCDWATNFGPQRLNLQGMNSKQTRLLAEATSGEESNAWGEATRWLEQVERDANAAQSAANTAIELLETDDLPVALSKVKEACQLESKYRQPVVWTPLCKLISKAKDGQGVDRIP